MIKKAIAAALLAASLLPAAAIAQDVRIKEQVVYFGDLDLSERADASAMLSRLRRASGQVCRTNRNQPLRVSREASRCKMEALNSAVAAVNAPQLNALHDGQAQLRVLASR